MANSTLDRKALSLTRRDFLKLCGSFSIAALLAACGAAPTPTAMSTHTPFPSSTPSMTPSLTPTATATTTPSVTPTAILRITPGEWASFVQSDKAYSEKSKGKVDPQKIFPYVGSVDQTNQCTLDLAFGTMQLAVNTGQVITADDHTLEKTKVAQDLESQTGFRQQLEAIRARMASAYKDEPDSRNFTVVVAKTTTGYKATQAIYRKVEEWGRVKVSDQKGNLVHDTTYPKKETTVRYRITNDAILELMTEEPVLQSLLELKEGGLYAEGHQVLLEGAMAPHFINKGSGDTYLGKFKNDVTAMKNLDPRFNYLVFQFNAAIFKDSKNMADLLEAIKWVAHP